MSATEDEELLGCFSRMTSSERRRALEFVRSLAEQRGRGTPGRSLLRFRGTLDAGDLAAMAEAIEEACEGIDADEW